MSLGRAAGLVLLPTAILFAPAATTTATPAFWGANGHRIVAQIGNRHLSEDAASRVVDILGPGELRLAKAATWPDEIRSDPRWVDTAPWHFLTVEDTASYQDQVRPAPNISSVRNVAEAIQFFRDLLGGDREKRSQFEGFMATRGVEPYLGSVEASALSLLVHFVGDIHQPLHVGRGEDRGGNGIAVNWFESPTNLHTVWDEGLIGKQELSFTELARVLDSPTDVQVVQWQSDALGTWIQESIDLRGQVYAITADDVPRDAPNPRSLPARFQNPLPYLGYQYAFLNTGSLNQRLLQGGVRLAGLLDGILR